MLQPNYFRNLSRDQKLALYAEACFNAKQIRQQEHIDPLNQFGEDPLAFITQGLHQCIEESWQGWRTVIKAAFGQPLNQNELDFFHQVAGDRDPPANRVKELWIVVGRRGGKDSIASLIAVNAARYADCTALRPGERALVACLASDRDQASIVFNYIKGYFETNPNLRSWAQRDLPQTYRSGPIQLSNSTDISVVTNNFRAPRGRPIACAIFDECAFWRDENSATPDFETYRAIRPGMATIPNSMLIGISSPYRTSGLLYDKWREFYGKDSDDTLVIQAESRLFNPTLSQDEIDKDLEADPEAAAAEWLARFRQDLADYVQREVVEECKMAGVKEIQPLRGRKYKAFVDPSGGSRDSFTLAIGHTSDNRKGTLDFLKEVRAPFQPAEVVKELSEDLKRYGIQTIRGDRYAGQWPVEQFGNCGIIYEQSAIPKSDIYREFLPLLNSRRVDLLDNPRLINQTCGLERRTARGGRDSIDHAPNALDDVINAVAGVLIEVTIELSSWELLALRQAELRAAQEQTRA